jgi:tRNA (uracil-5-)-methyltransferase
MGGIGGAGWGLRRFRISVDSFFQVNTKGAEALYRLIGEWAAPDPHTTVFDICCGTGTIGLTLANNAKEVIGLEILPSAVEDARANATLNGVHNARFLLGKAEDTLAGVLDSFSGKCVGIVDPPRAGLHSSIIKAIRKCTALKRLVYVSCRQEAFLDNVGELCRSESNTLVGAPFRPTRAAAVDMFPHTSHVELVVLFERE